MGLKLYFFQLGILYPVSYTHLISTGWGYKRGLAPKSFLIFLPPSMKIKMYHCFHYNKWTWKLNSFPSGFLTILLTEKKCVNFLWILYGSFDGETTLCYNQVVIKVRVLLIFPLFKYYSFLHPELFSSSPAEKYRRQLSAVFFCFLFARGDRFDRKWMRHQVWRRVKSPTRTQVAKERRV